MNGQSQTANTVCQIKSQLIQLNRFRSILIRWAKKPANYLALLHFVCGIICWCHALPG